MTAKDKAQDLVDTYRIILIHTDTEVSHEILCTTVAKCCALAAVNEVMDAMDWHEYEVPNDEFTYWEQVKQEIEKL